jgi:hypothetical protein
VRDYISGNPAKDISTSVPGVSTVVGRQHNFFTPLGLVLRF